MILTYIKILPYDLQKNESIPTVTYKLGDRISNNNLNYKDVKIYKDLSFSLNTDLCECERSKFYKPPYKHVLIGDLGIIENKAFQKFFNQMSKLQKTQVTFTHKSLSDKHSIEEMIQTNSNYCKKIG